MARMGVYLEEQVARRYPEFPTRTGLVSWEEYLPPLSPLLRELLQGQSGVLDRLSFLDAIFANLQKRANEIVVREIRDGQFVSATGQEFLSLVSAGATICRGAGLKKGRSLRAACSEQHSLDSVRSGADLRGIDRRSSVHPAIRQRACRHDSRCRACRSVFVRRMLWNRKFARIWRSAITRNSIGRSLWQRSGCACTIPSLLDSDPVTIVYTSGTSGEPKGVILTAGNVNHILKCTNAGWIC